MHAGSRPTEHRLSIGGIEIACFEWNADARGREPTLLMAHATGFHARCWDAVIEHLDDRHVVAVDLRGHGRSTSVEIEHWRDVGEDLVGVMAGLDLSSVFGIGHSMGAHAMVDAAALCPDRVCGLYLFDPVIGDPATYGGATAGQFAKFAAEGHPTARRRNAFASPAEMIERFENRLPFGRFDEKVLRDYCEYGLLPASEGGFELACPPRVEGSVYMTSRSNVDIFDSVRTVAVPVLIVRAQLAKPGAVGVDFSTSPTWPGLVDLFPNAREMHLTEATHFLPLEDPALIASQIAEHGKTLPVTLGSSTC
jgi:lipase